MRSMIMARICLFDLNFLKAMIVDETETLECSFAVLDSILHKNSCVWKLTSVQGEKEIHVTGDRRFTRSISDSGFDRIFVWKDDWKNCVKERA